MPVMLPIFVKVLVNDKPIVIYFIEMNPNVFLEYSASTQNEVFAVNPFRFLNTPRDPFSQTKIDDETRFRQEIEKRIHAVMNQAQIKEVYPEYQISF